MTPTLFEDCLDLLTELDAADVEYLVVGAHALAAHGVVRATSDFDILVKPTPSNAVRVVAALRRFGAPLGVHGVGEADFARLGTVYQMGLPPVRIDLLTQISGVPFEEAWDSHIRVHTSGRVLPVLGRDALLKNKLATGRAKDVLDAQALMLPDVASQD